MISSGVTKIEPVSRTLSKCASGTPESEVLNNPASYTARNATTTRVKPLHCKGFALKELIAVLAILMLLAIVLIPWVLQSRAISRRDVCERRQQQLALAFMQYHDDFRQLPGYSNLQAVDQSGSPRATGWVFPLTPYIGLDTIDEGSIQTPRYAEIYQQFGPLGKDQDRGQTPQAVLHPLLCPDNLPQDIEQWVGLSSYMVNSGMPDLEQSTQQEMKQLPPDWPANGIFQNQFSGRNNPAFKQYNLEEISELDGRENTLLLGENINTGKWTDSSEDEVGFVWAGAKTSSDLRPLAINAERERTQHTMQTARLSSYHPGGVNVLMASGATLFINELIDQELFNRRMTPDDKKARYPGTEEYIWPVVEEK
ncbi:MAG: hypothetical protein COA78_20710 [Blastopirellula sp.]|nr:MAG: hypothetical protein COA78_20710 [Blastopirellula sp.]